MHYPTLINIAEYDWDEYCAFEPASTDTIVPNSPCSSRFSSSTILGIQDEIPTSAAQLSRYNRRVQRLVTGFYHVTQMILSRIGRRRLVQTLTSTQSSSSFIRPHTAEPFYETAIPSVPIMTTLNSSYSRNHMSRFFSWNPVRIRRDSDLERERTFRRLNFLSRRRRRRQPLNQMMQSSGSDLTYNNELSLPPSNSFTFGQEDIRQQFGVFMHDVYSADTLSERDFEQVPAFASESLPARTSSRIVRFSFHRTRSTPDTPYPMANRRSSISPSLDPLEPELTNRDSRTTSTGCSSGDSVSSRRRSFRHSLGRNRDLFEMLGSFEHFYDDPLE